MKDDLIRGHLGRGPFIIDDKDDEDGKRSWEDVAELAQQHPDQRRSSMWKVGMQVRVVDDELEPEIRCAGWMAVKDDVASVDILAHAVAESELDDGLAVEEPARRARLGRHPEEQHVFQFGMYRNERYEEVTEKHPTTISGVRRNGNRASTFNTSWSGRPSTMSWIQCVLLSRPRRQERSRLRQKARSRPSRSSRSLCARKSGNKHRNVFPGVTRGTQHELVPMQHTSACGTVIQGEIGEPTVRSPEACPHENTDARGSSSTTHRVYCKDCGQYVYECPQLEWRQQQNETRSNLLRGRTERIDLKKSASHHYR